MINDYQNFMKVIPLPCLVVKPSKKGFIIENSNQEHEKLIRKKNTDIRGLNVLEAFKQNSKINEEGWLILKKHCEEVLKTKSKKEITNLQYDLLDENTGKFIEKYWDIKNVPLLDEHTNVEFILIIFLDKSTEVLEKKRLNQFELKLQKINEESKYFVEQNPSGLYSLDIEGNFLSVNKSLVEISETPEIELLNMNFLPFCAPCDKDFILQQFQDTIAGHNRKFEANFITGKGRPVILDLSLIPMKLDGKIQGVYGIAIDVSEMNERNAKIKELHERYKLIATATDDLTYDWDLKTDKVLRFLEDKQTIFGYSSEEIEKRNFWKEHIHPEEIIRIKKILVDTLKDTTKTKIRTRYRLLQADGTYAHIIDTAHILRDNKGQAIRLIGGARDVSDIVEGKEALKDSNLRFSYAMRATREMIWDWNIIKNDVKRSRAFKEIYGDYKEKELDVENFWFSKIHHKDRKRVMESLQSALLDTNKKKWKDEYRFIHDNGEQSYVIDRGYIIRDRNGKAIRMIGAVLDITERHALLKDIKKQNKLLKEVAWEQAHIVRAPLARLKGLLVMLEENSFEEWTSEELFELIRDSADQVDEIITNIIKKTENFDIKLTDGRKF
ncbi:PAS domain-containing protein [Gillisia sp. JM1]|uniref:PAS domain-containing protein n=1 Tax=Gillisia sp. JM1 TaxID=1283286 RepID=UPI00047CF95D|nr:PAS domain-containing protein [Gillisia sp. JM1]